MEESAAATGDQPRAQASGPELAGRASERRVLDRLARDVQAGESRVLVLHGEPGVGKTALLDYLSRPTPAGLLTRACGLPSETELPFAGVHQLCAPLLDQLGSLPAPQREAMRIAFGSSAGPVPDSFLIGQAVLGLLSAAADGRSLLCLVDNQQWLDQASGQVLGLIARQLGADPVGLVFATRQPGAELAGLPKLEVRRLAAKDSRSLLETALIGPMDAQVKDLIIAKTGGNPLALLELLRGLTPEQLAGGFGLPLAAAGPQTDAVLRAWQRGQASAAPDESVAAEL
jgi:hypothetical protein